MRFSAEVLPVVRIKTLGFVMLRGVRTPLGLENLYIKLLHLLLTTSKESRNILRRRVLDQQMDEVDLNVLIVMRE